jgi:hypothetical protein
LLQQIQKQIETLQLQVADKEKTIQELYADTNLIPPEPKRPVQSSKDCPKICQRWDGGNLSCRHHCDMSHFQNYDKTRELRQLRIRMHITPVIKEKENLEAKIKDLELKSTLPYLRNELITSITDFQELEKTDPQYRQKQMDLKKSIYKQSERVDELETKFNWFANIPTTQPKIITPDPIVQTTLDYEVNKRPLLILGALGLVGLFLIWRMK